MTKGEGSKRTRRCGGRAGPRAAAAGYDFQDLYVASHLARLLLRADRDPPEEILWEKRAIDWSGDGPATHVVVDDVILSLRSGRRIYVEVKETRRRSAWRIAELTASDILSRFWSHWNGVPAEFRSRSRLRLATDGDVTDLRILIDAARRCRTMAELDEESAASADLRSICAALSLEPRDPALLPFLKAIEAEPLPPAAEIEDSIARTLSAAGPAAPDIMRCLVRLVARSKHGDASACSGYTRDSLIDDLRSEGVTDATLIGIGAVRASPLATPAVLDAYREGLIKEYRAQRVYGLQLRRPVSVDLFALFVSPVFATLGEQRRDAGSESAHHRSWMERLLVEDESPAEPAKRENDDVVDLRGLLAASRRILVVGGPGTGKTTLLKWLAIVSAMRDPRSRDLLDLPSAALLPLYVRFRDFGERVKTRFGCTVPGRVGLVQDFVAVLAEAGLFGGAPTPDDARSIAQEFLEREDSVLLFDGLDEVADERLRSALFEAVTDLLRQYTQPRVIIATRPYALPTIQAEVSDLLAFEPLPLDRTAQQAFARKWYVSVRSQKNTPLEADDARARADDLVTAVARVPDLAANPLLLSILAAVHFNRDRQGLPIDRATLYDHATLAMLGHWDRDPAGHGLGDDAIPADWAGYHLDEKQVREMAEQLAYRVQVHEGGGEFSRDVAIEVLGQALLDVGATSERQRQKRAGVLLQTLLDRSGIVQERSPGVLAFAHLTFQEYLAARCLVRKPDLGLAEVAGLASDERHAEVARLAVGLLSGHPSEDVRKRAGALVAQLTRVNPLLAAASLLEAGELDLDPDDAERLAQALLMPEDDDDHHHFMMFRFDPPRAFGRIVWAVLGRTAHPDRLFLEFLSEGTLGRRHPEEFEVALSLFAARPALPISPELKWVLHRLTCIDEERLPLQLGALASLLMVEAGEAQPIDCVEPLLRLYGAERWMRHADPRRAEAFLERLWAGGDAERLRVIIERVLSGSPVDADLAWSALKFLSPRGFEFALPRDTAQAVVAKALYDRSRHDEAVEVFGPLAKREGTRSALLPALREGLSDPDKDVRTGCRKVLDKAGLGSPDSHPDAAAEDQDEDALLVRLQSALGDPATANGTVLRLAEELWEEDTSVSWRAARALLAAGYDDVAGIPQALVRAGFSKPERRPLAFDHLRALRALPAQDYVVRAALLDGVRSTTGAVAAAAALMVLEFGEYKGEARMQRLVAATLLDHLQIEAALPALAMRLDDRSDRDCVVRAISEYLGGKDIAAPIAAATSVLLVSAGELKARNLPTGLVHGLGDPVRHQEAWRHLRTMLDDLDLVTEARSALRQGLGAKEVRVAWGSATCLLDAGYRTEPELAASLIRVGLKDEGRREKARATLMELLAHPWTAPTAARTLREEIQGALNGSDANKWDQPLAWEAATCLVEAKLWHTEGLVEALVWAGLYREEWHERSITAMRELLEADPSAAENLEDELSGALDHSGGAVAIGAAKALVRLGTRVADDVVHGSKKLWSDAEKRKKPLHLLTVLLRDEAQGFAEDVLDPQGDVPRQNGLRLAFSTLLGSLLGDGQAKKDNWRNKAGPVFAAAKRALAMGGVEPALVARGLVEGGLSLRPTIAEAGRALDQFRSRPECDAAAWEALNAAVWGENDDVAWGAAVYLMDRGDYGNPGIAHAFAHAGFSNGRRDGLAAARLHMLLQNPTARPWATMALLQRAHTGYSGDRYRAVSILLRGGAELVDGLVRVLNEQRESWPLAPLALLAVTGQVENARKAALRVGATKLSAILGGQNIDE